MLDSNRYFSEQVNRFWLFQNEFWNDFLGFLKLLNRIYHAEQFISYYLNLVESLSMTEFYCEPIP